MLVAWQSPVGAQSPDKRDGGITRFQGRTKTLTAPPCASLPEPAKLEQDSRPEREIVHFRSSDPLPPSGTCPCDAPALKVRLGVLHATESGLWCVHRLCNEARQTDSYAPRLAQDRFSSCESPRALA